MKLGWLSRLGIVATAIGLPAAALYMHEQEYERATGFRDVMYKLCTERAERDGIDGRYTPAMKKCMDERLDPGGVMPKLSYSVYKAVFYALLAWVAALVVYWSGRWILAGRKPSAP